MPRNNLGTIQVAVAFTPTLLISANSNRTGVLVTNMSAFPVFIGNSNVTIMTGSFVPGVVGAGLSFSFYGDVYGICDAGLGSSSVSVLEIFN